MKRKKTIFSVILFLIAALIILLNLLEPFIKSRLISEFHSRTGMEMRMESFSAGLLKGIDIQGLAIFDKQGKMLISADRIKARLSLAALIRKRVVLTSLSIKKLKADTAVAQAFSNTSPQEDSSGGSFSFFINSLKLQDSSFIHRGKSTGVDIEKGKFSFAKGEIKLLIKSALLKRGSSALKIKEFQAGGDISGDSFNFETIYLGLREFELSGNLKAQKDAPFSLEGKISSEGKVGNIADFASEFFPYEPGLFNGRLFLKTEIAGTREKPDITAEMQINEFDIDKGYIDSAFFNLNYSENKVEIKEALIRDPQGGSIFFTALYDIGLKKMENFDSKIDNYSIASTSFLPAEAHSNIENALLNGSFSFAGSLSQKQELYARANLVLSGAAYRKKKLEDLAFNLQIDKGTGLMDFKTGASALSARVEYTNEISEGSFRILLKNIENFARYLDIDNIEGEAQLEGSFSGLPQNPRLSIQIKSADLMYNMIPIVSSGGKIYYREGDFSFEGLNLQGDFKVRESPLIHNHVPSIKGELSYEATISGAYQNIKVNFNLLFSSPSFKSYEADELYASGSYAGGITKVDSFFLKKGFYLLMLENPLSVADKAGNIDLGIYKMQTGQKYSPRQMNAKREDSFKNAGDLSIIFDLSGEDYIEAVIEKNDIDLKIVETILKPDFTFSGLLTGKTEFRGNIKNPEVDILLSLNRASINDREISRASVSFNLKNEILRVDDFQLATPESGNLSASFSFDITDIENLNFLPDIKAASRGEIKARDLDLTLINNLTASTVLNSGRASFHINWSEILPRPSVEGEIQISDASFFTHERREVKKINLFALLKDNTLNIESLSLQDKNMDAELSGIIKMPSRNSYEWELELLQKNIETAAITGRFDGEEIYIFSDFKGIDMSGFAGFIPQVKTLEGKIDSEITVKGAVADPNIEGSLNISGLAFSAIDLADSLQGGEAEITFDEKKIEIKKFTGKLQNGNIKTSGTLNHKARKIVKADVKASAENLKVDLENTAKGSISKADISLTNRKDRLILSGLIELGEFILMIEDADSAVSPKDEPDAPRDNIFLELSLKTGNNLWMHNTTGRLRLEGELNIRGAIRGPVLTGRIYTREGYVNYLDRRFKISEGFVDFDGHPQNMPLIDILAQTRIRSLRQAENIPYDIDIKVHGRADDIQVELSSDPPLDSPDIISLLAFGATRTQLTTTESLFTKRAAEIASARVAGYISAHAGNILNLDLMLIEGNIFRAGSSYGPRIQARKDISENFALAYVGNLSPQDSAIVAKRVTGKTEISYTEGIGTTTGQELQLRYRLTPNLSAEGLTDHTGRSNIGLNYSIWIK
ncbi:MAG: translocation/assembly module TamB domain-containing protein [Elusimicrobiota bacterium]